jgi:glycosyltransferase involved in cell wall biosynthesis
VKESVIILIPVYNDQASLEILISILETTLASDPSKKYSVLIVNDGSTQPVGPRPAKSFDINILHLHRNIGHQKAIAIGLSHIHHNSTCDHVVIMDADGEDRPADILTLIKTSIESDGKIVAARRKGRQESTRFRTFYFFYKILFRWLTGKEIGFGNFMAIPKAKLDKLVYHSEIWNHLPAGVIKSKLPLMTIPLDRGKRYAETSKMNFTSLVLHGLGAIAVFLEQVASRLLMLSFVLIIVSVVVILSILGIRYFTDWAIPGWASTILSSMLIILLQGFLLSLFTIFLFLSSQSQRQFIPAHHYEDYFASLETIPHA